MLLVKDTLCECTCETGSTVTVITSMGEKASRKRKSSKGIQGVFHGIILEETRFHLQQDNTSPEDKDRRLLGLSLLRPSPPFMAGQIVWIMVDEIAEINCDK